jgi:hypothetical protein
MTSRQARRQRREQERKEKKAAYKASLRAAVPALSSGSGINPELLDEFTPEFLAHANSVRQRIQANHLHSEPRAKRPEDSLLPVRTESHPAEPAPKSRGVDEPALLSEAKTRVDEPAVLREAKTQATRSSRNSLKHGLASDTLIIPGEDPAAFESLLESLLAEHQPAGTTEAMLIREIAQSYWLSQRALRFQNDCFTEAGVDEKRLSLFLRYHTTHERAFHKALNALIRLQKDRRKLALALSPGFVSQPGASPDHKAGFVSQPGAPPDHKLGFVSQPGASPDHKLGFVAQPGASPDHKLGFVSQNDPCRRSPQPSSPCNTTALYERA